MFDVGFQELMLIFVILLIVVGPERLPKLARTLGLWIGKARTIVSSVKSEVEREIRVSELKQSLQEQAPTEEFRKLANQVKSINSDLKSTGKEIESSIQSAAEYNGPKTNTQTEATTSGYLQDKNADPVENLASSTISSSSSSDLQSSSDAKAKVPAARADETSSNDKVSTEKL